MKKNLTKIKQNLFIEKKTLEWGEISEKEMDWQEAKEWCENKGEGWRMPTGGELLQAYDEGLTRNWNLPGSYFWSSTELYLNTAYAWGVYLSYGYTTYTTKVSSYYVRCVRSLGDEIIK